MTNYPGIDTGLTGSVLVTPIQNKNHGCVRVFHASLNFPQRCGKCFVV